MTLLANIGTQFFDDNGDPLAGGKINFYVTGTTTNQNTYSDRALASENTNPVVLDAAGRLTSDVYLDPDLLYKVVITDSSDVTIDTQDGDGISALVEHTSDRRKLVARSPMDDGAVGDGATDDATALQLTLDTATSCVDLEGLTYRIDTAMALTASHNGLVIRNGTIDTSNTFIAAFDMDGSFDTPVNLLSDAAVGDTSLSLVSAGSFATGDMVLLASSSGGDEIVFVSSMSGATMNLRSPVKYSHTTAGSALVSELTPIKDIRFENIRVIGGGALGSNFATIDYGKNISFRDCALEAGAKFIDTNRSHGLKASGILFDTNTDAGQDSDGVCLYLEDTFDCSFSDFELLGCRTFAQTVGNSSGMRFAHVNATQCTAPIIHAAGSRSPRYTDCWFDCQPETTATDDAAVISGGGCVMTDVTFINAADVGILITDATSTASRYVFNNCRVESEDTAISVTSTPTTEVEINGGYYYSTQDNYGGYFNATAAGLTIRANGASFRQTNTTAAQYAFHVLADAGATANAIVNGCYIQRAADNGVCAQLQGTDASSVTAIVTGNLFSNGTYSLNGVNCFPAIEQGNVFRSASSGRVGAHSVQGAWTRAAYSGTISVEYDFDNDGGGSPGTITLTDTVTLPDNAVVILDSYEVLTTFTSSSDTATVKLALATDGDLSTAIAINDAANPWDAGAFIADSNNVAPIAVKTTGDRLVQIVTAVQALTAGKAVFHLRYYVTE